MAEVVVASRLTEGFRITLQTMGLANLKPNIVCMRYPEIWRDPQYRCDAPSLCLAHISLRSGTGGALGNCRLVPL